MLGLEATQCELLVPHFDETARQSWTDMMTIVEKIRVKVCTCFNVYTHFFTIKIMSYSGNICMLDLFYELSEIFRGLFLKFSDLLLKRYTKIIVIKLIQICALFAFIMSCYVSVKE